jgi:ABC-type antimicrobial peptide transport system permease subunit
VLADVARTGVIGLLLGVSGAAILHALFARYFVVAAGSAAVGEAVATAIMLIATIAGAAVPAWTATQIDAIELLRET